MHPFLVGDRAIVRSISRGGGYTPDLTVHPDLYTPEYALKTPEYALHFTGVGVRIQHEGGVFRGVLRGGFRGDLRGVYPTPVHGWVSVTLSMYTY